MDFLARRYSKEFLAFYVEKHPELLDRVAEPGLQLSAVSEADLAPRLHEHGLLPEPQRLKFVETVSGYALRGEDLYALKDHDIRSVFTDQEFEDFRQQVRTDLVPRLAEVRREWESNYSSGESADDFMDPLRDSFRALTGEFVGDDEVKEIVDMQSALVDEWIGEHTEEEPADKPRRTLGDVETLETLDESRSIFDDIDV